MAANHPRRLRRPQHCAWMSLSLADIAAKHSSICRRISVLFRQKSRHATAPITTTSSTDVHCYRTLVVDESLGIYPTVEGCGVPGPFYQNFPSLVTPPQDGLNSIRLTLRYDDFLEFWFVERNVQFITVPIDQTMHGWVGLVRVNYHKQFSCPVRHLSLFEVLFSFAYAYSITDSELRCADAFVTIQSLSHGFMIGTGHF